ncbi:MULTISPECIES: zinc-binding dehydrogenase [Lonsdalea]|uniref:Alcohol dehydrogenase n=2 Tax=Lonsdalea TaxID=1082702 RepID=A0ACD1JD20_9GAMM|nr:MULTISPECIES: zinc-binding dehydrogenase [Lonsdalea]OSN01957.1 alcohol dehydrogenase [Lonsdalea populi]QPQ25333.1 zinc-binding dehydrogenase [Lonsdalea populi]RAT13951.1 alcohol dehydrogenase [Lonsdalea quercina]RAT15527.1 alcohol dehydrogenase [Lonsdalea quercina]RAT21922.1 alcohol dehydrogenase [Lonsdalea populi]
MTDKQREVLPETYRAWTWHGGIEPRDLKLEHIPLPPPAADQVLVRNVVIGLNPVDWKLLGAESLRWRPGKVPGVDGAGVVAAVGEDVSDRWLGQRVAYHQNMRSPGSFAEYAPVDMRALLRLPPQLDFAIAASVPCPALTAWLALDKLPPQAGQPVLISGAGGAVGHYLVQLAGAFGFNVTAMSHHRHWERLRTLGAKDCVASELAGDPHWLEENAGFFAVIDSVSADHAERLSLALQANGHLVCIQDRIAHWPCAPFGRAISLHEVALGALHQFGDEAAWARLTAAGELLLIDLAEERLQAEARVVCDFSELPLLLDELRRRSFSGKPLVRV